MGQFLLLGLPLSLGVRLEWVDLLEDHYAIQPKWHGAELGDEGDSEPFKIQRVG